MKAWIALVPLMVYIGACQSLGLARGQAALLESASERVESDLSNAIRDMLGASKVLIDARQLTRVPRLLIERIPAVDENGVQRDGIVLEMPEAFQLEIHDGHCRIVHLRTGQYRVLPNARCVQAK